MLAKDVLFAVKWAARATTGIAGPLNFGDSQFSIVSEDYIEVGYVHALFELDKYHAEGRRIGGMR